ncbi:MAG: hypothetical protein JWN32_2520 [Solirubrobacterales bacterium]|nr:hypothetical protein [Solirubrobacterales bacterium]
MSEFPARAALRLVQPAPVELQPIARFCGHCGNPPTAAQPSTRVCDRCGLGLVLETVVEAAPSRGAPFLVLDTGLMICAMSAAAQRELAVDETEAVHRHVNELLVAADAEPGTRASLADVVVRAARGDGETTTIAVRPAHTFGVFFEARIAPCGPPRAALVVLH